MKPTQIRTIFSVAITAALFSNPAFSEKEELIVTAKGGQTLQNTLSTTHIFNEEDIRAAQVKEIPALLDKIAGISFTDSGGRGSATSLFIRGTANSQIIVLVDGVRVGSATLGAAALNNFPIEAIERIEVIKGPFSGLYGADAVGGVIQLFTKKTAQGNTGSVTLGYGSDSLREGALTLSVGNEKHGFTVSAFGEQGSGIDRTSITTQGNDDTDGFEEAAISIAGKTTLAPHTVAQLSVLYSENEVEFDNTFGADPGSFTETDSLNAAVNLISQVNKQLRWHTTLGYFEEDAETTSSFSSIFSTQRASITSELSYQLSPEHTLTTGIDYYDEDIDTSSDFPVNQRDNIGVFAQWQSYLNRWSLVGSLRYDDNSAYESQTNGSIAIGYTFSDALRVNASYGSAFVAPSFNFLYFPFFGNPDLLPEESDNYEISLVGKIKSLDWRLSAYQTDVDNLFSVDSSTFLAANIGNAELKGIELALNTQLWNWDIDVNFDVLSAENEDTGTELDDRAETTINLGLSRDFNKLNLSFDMKFEEDRFDRSGTRLASYALFDVGAIYRWSEKFSASITIDNIFDKDYTVNLISATQRFNTQGRQAKITLRYQL